MYTFIKYLQEKKFAKAKDQDYTVDDLYVLSFNEKDKDTYRPTGDKTHDSASHAIKHLGEFEPQEMKHIIASAKDDIIQYLRTHPDQFMGVLKKSDEYVTDEAQEALKKADLYIIGNTLDLINDKKILKQSLNEIEKILVKYISRLESNYLTIIKDKMKIAVKLTGTDEEIYNKIEKSDVIELEAWQGVGIAVDIILDFRDNSIIITTPDYIRTMFQFDNPAKGRRQIIKNFYSKKFTLNDKKVDRILKTY